MAGTKFGSGKKATVAPVRGSSPSGDVPGGPGKSMPAKPIQGPKSPGMPISMKKALKKK